MPNATFKTRAKVFLWSGDKAAWHFVSIPKTTGAKLEKAFKRPKRGWGSIPVIVTIGKTTFKTSVFPDKKSGTFVLPLKKKVRKAEGIENGKTISFTLEVDRFRP